MIHIAIVEDEEKERLAIKDFTEKYFASRQEPISIRMFTDGDELLYDYPEDLDILFLDIQMKRMDGIAAAKKIRTFDEKVILLFVTNMVQFALEGYSVDAADFIIKPLSYESFCARMERVMRRLDAAKERFITCNNGRETLYVRINELSYAETLNKRTILHRLDGSTQTVTDPLYLLENQLKPYGFYRCHNAFLVNMRQIRGVNAADITVGSETIPLSKHRKKEFLSEMAAYLGNLI